MASKPTWKIAVLAGRVCAKYHPDGKYEQIFEFSRRQTLVRALLDNTLDFVFKKLLN